MELHERKEMQSSKTHLVPDSQRKSNQSNAPKSKRWQVSALKPKGPLKNERKKQR